MRVQANMADLTFLVWLKVKKTDRCASSAFHKYEELLAASGAEVRFTHRIDRSTLFVNGIIQYGIVIVWYSKHDNLIK